MSHKLHHILVRVRWIRWHPVIMLKDIKLRQIHINRMVTEKKLFHPLARFTIKPAACTEARPTVMAWKKLFHFFSWMFIEYFLCIMESVFCWLSLVLIEFCRALNRTSKYFNQMFFCELASERVVIITNKVIFHVYLKSLKNCFVNLWVN